MALALKVVSERYAGHRRVLAYITAPRVVRAILHHLGLPSRALPLAPARDPPQASFVADLCA